MAELVGFGQRAEIAAGELISYRKGDHEFIHQKGSPGWRSSDTEMFPVIGPTAEANFKVKTPKGAAIQDQHGLLRELTYIEALRSETKISFSKKYSANTAVKNSKYPNKSSAENLIWPYSFEFQKNYELKEEGLEITFEISAEEGMPFMLGYHPAFKLHTQRVSVIPEKTENAISLAAIKAVGSRAYQVPNCESIRLQDKQELKIRTEGFGHFMLWTEVDNMVCIEPITFYPYAVPQSNLHDGFMHLNDKTPVFKVFLCPISN